MPVRPHDTTITPAEGGRLRTAGSLQGVGWANYCEKVNFRAKGAGRTKDVEGRREGWILFRPNAGLPQGVQAVPTANRVLLLAECVRPNLERAVIAATQTEIFKFDYGTGAWAVVGSGYSASGKRWQSAIIDGTLVLNNQMDIPQSIRVEENAVVPLKELREIGVARVGHICEQNGYLQLFDVTDIIASELNAWMNGPTPYGVVPEEKCNRVAYKAQWGEFSNPRGWAPIFSVTMAASSTTLSLPFASAAFIANQTRVAVLGGGPNGGVLGGQTGYEKGILVTAVAGNQITLEIPTDAALSYPRTVQVVRWADQSTLAGVDRLQDDSSEIIGAKKLGSRTIIYRTSGIFRSTYIGNPKKPFEFRPVYYGKNVPAWSNAIGDVNGEFHLYPGEGGRFYAFDGTSEPYIHDVCDDARNLFTDGLTPASDVFAVDNPITKELWFCRPGRVFAYDYEFRTVSEIDAEIHAAAFIRRPGAADRWFILAIEGSVFTYGLVESAVATVLTYHRNGVNPGGRLKSGLIHWRDRYNEKDLVCYLLHLASGISQVDLQLRLHATFDEREAPSLVLTENFTGPTYMVRTLYRALYFQDELRITETADVDVAVAARTFEAKKPRTKSTPRNNA